MAAAYPVANLKNKGARYSRKVRILAETAVWSLREEAELTPKPGLVDRRGAGVHRDMNLAMLLRSATVLYPTFLELAHAADGVGPSVELRKLLGAIGREGEATMMRATGGCNTHRGAIWTLGLLCAAAASLAESEWTPALICRSAAAIARLCDGDAPRVVSHGEAAGERYGVRGARGEAECGFPHVLHRALPILHASRTQAANEGAARLTALMGIITTLDDTCLLHRGGAEALRVAQRGAWRVLQSGGAGTLAGLRALLDLDSALMVLNSSPGGAADLLAAALFLDRLTGDNQ